MSPSNTLNKTELTSKINKLKREKNAIILAHFYQEPDIQDIADFIGDSLGLSQQAATTNADIIAFAGVHFMAETAKIINPTKRVVLPDLNAGCSLADSCPSDKFKAFIEQYPEHVIVTYINCSAEVKALSDIVCTSANAIKIIQSIPKDKKIIFAPDENLGKYLIKETGRDMVLWKGSCVVHEMFSLDKILKVCKEHPKAKIIAHPESDEKILHIAHFIGSTSALLKYVQQDRSKEYIIATEEGILHQMRKHVPEKILIPAPVEEDNTCACSECAYMKVNSLEKLYLCLKNEKPEIIISETLRIKALRPIEKMLELSN